VKVKLCGKQCWTATSIIQNDEHADSHKNATGNNRLCPEMKHSESICMYDISESPIPGHGLQT